MAPFGILTTPRHATTSPLDTLAARCGIEKSFLDALGKTQTCSPETQRALLLAMHVAAEDDEAVRRSLRSLEEEDWSKPLNPVYVVYAADSSPHIDINLPPGSAAMTWRVKLEDGSERSGDFNCAKLTRVATYTTASEQTLHRLQLPLPGSLPEGYHRLSLSADEESVSLIVVPGRCWLPAQVDKGGRSWGVAAQLYLLKSTSNWGIGDFSDLRQFAEVLAHQGADVIGLNPLHAMFVDAPEHASPYSPASRLLLNVLNIDVPRVVAQSSSAEARAMVASASFQQSLEKCRATALVDYSGVVALKLPVLRLVFASVEADRNGEHWAAFEAQRRERGDVFERQCLFLALRTHFAQQGAPDWHSWPEEYRDPAALSVRDFARHSRDLVDFQAWLQVTADTQLATAAQAATSMAVGLYRDLAVGADPSGGETWANQGAVVEDARVGAPPDIYNPPGQDWGLPPFSPRALYKEAYSSFIELVRANMRHAGGLRIDHVMALQQLYWVPKDQSPAKGAYVRYPIEDLVGILTLESQRNECMIVGEDLGTVPEGFRERMTRARILSYRVLFFETDQGAFVPPERYPDLALAVTGSHDLPTLRGWWDSSDLELKRKLGLFPTAKDETAAVARRLEDRKQLVVALQREHLLDSSGEPIAIDDIVLAAHEFLARTHAAFAVVQLDDVTGEATPVNVPTTSDEHPNWRRRMSLSLEEIAEHPLLAKLGGLFRAERSGERSSGRTRGGDSRLR